jgi:hypothetical protein
VLDFFLEAAIFFFPELLEEVKKVKIFFQFDMRKKK